MKLSRLLLAAVAASLACIPSGVSAQRTGTRMGADLKETNLPQALEIVAECVASRRPALGRKWLNMLPGSPEEGALVLTETGDFEICSMNDRLVMDGKEITITPAMVRRPLAAAMAKRLLADAPAQIGLTIDSPVWFMPALAQLPAGTAVDRSSLILQDFGHCVAVTDWAGTRAFLKSKPGSRDEKAGLSKLVPVLGPCLSEDAKVTLTPANLRVVLAEPVYHILTSGAASLPAATGR